MRKNIRPILFALLLAALPAYGQFEGVVEMKMSMAGKDGAARGGGTIIVAVAKAGTRSEMNMQMGPMAIKTVTLQKAGATNTLYRIDDARKTYTEVDLAKAREAGGTQPTNDQYTVTRFGQETVLGYQTQHVLVRDKNPGAGNGKTAELWTAKDLLDYATFSKLQASRDKGGVDAALVKALKDAGADGLPLKSVGTAADGSKLTMEVVKVEKRELPASTFEIPEGYTKSAGNPMDMMAGSSGTQTNDPQRWRREAAEKMSQQQRELYEKLMKARNAAGK